eukprot:scaffold3803_cov62-Phaeocystis_antarctica.AAC.1
MPSEELGPASPRAEPSAGQRERRNRAAHARRASRRALDTDRTPVDARAADTADVVVADAAGCFTAWSGGVAVDVAKETWRPEGRCGSRA